MKKQLFFLLLLSMVMHGIEQQAPRAARASLQQQMDDLDNDSCCKEVLSLPAAGVTFIAGAFIHYGLGHVTPSNLATAALIGTASATAFVKLRLQKFSLDNKIELLKTNLRNLKDN